MTDVGTAVFRAVADFANLIKGAQGGADALDKMGASARDLDGKVSGTSEGVGKATTSWKDKFSNVADSMDKTGKKMSLGITAPLTVMGAVATKTFVDFDTSITQAGLKAGATSEEMAAMRDMAVDLGAKTVFSAGEAATGFDELASAGFTAKEGMAALPGVMLAAQAANEDLGLTAAVVAQSINAFGLEAGDASKVADIMSQAANTTALDMQGLGEAMAHAGQLGSSSNQSMEDVVATIGRLVDMGVPAASAGAAVRGAVMGLQAPSDKAAGLLKYLGVETRNAAGEMLPLPDLMANLEKGFSKSGDAAGKNAKLLSLSGDALKAWAAENGMSEKAAKNLQGVASQGGQAFQDYAMKTMFGVEGMKAMSLAMSDGKPVMMDVASETEKMQALSDGLAKSLGKDGAKAFIDANTEGGKFAATGSDAVRALSALNTASEGTSAKFGEAFSKTLGARIDQFKGSLESLGIVLVTSVLPVFQDLVGRMTSFFEKIGEFAKANPQVTQFVIGLLAVLAAVGPLLIAMSKVVTAVKIIGTLFSGTLARALVAHVASMTQTIALYAMYGAAAVKNAVMAGGAWVAQSARTVGAFVASTAAMLAHKAATVAVSLASKAAAAAQWLLNAAMSANPIGLIIAAIALLVAGFVWLWNNVEGFRNFWVAAWDLIKGAAVAVWSWIQDAATKTWEGIKAVWNGAIAFYKMLFTAVLTYFRTVWSTIGNLAKAAWEGIKTAWNAATAFFRALWSGITGIITKAWDSVTAAVALVVNTIRATWKAVLTILKTPIAAAVSFISGAFGSIKSAIGDAVTWIIDRIKSLATGVSTTIGKVVTYFKELPGRVLSGLGNIGETLLQAGKDLIQGLINGVTKMAQTAIDTVKNVGSKMVNGVKGIFGIASPSKVFAKIGQFVVQGLAKGVTSEADKAVAAIEGVAEEMTKAYEKAVANESKRVMEARKKQNDKIRAFNKKTKGTKNDKDLLPTISATEANKIAKKNLQTYKDAMTRAEKMLADQQRTTSIWWAGDDAATDQLANVIRQRGKHEYATLADFARAREVMATRIDAAKEKLADAVNLRDSFHTSVFDSARSFASLSGYQAAEGETKTAKGAVSHLRDRLARLRQWNDMLYGLREAGLNDTMFAALVQAGPDAGFDDAKALFADRDQIGEVNRLQADIDTVSHALGAYTAHVLYQPGVDAAAGFLQGLQSQDALIEQAAIGLANTVADAINRALQIKSPSRVLARIGEYAAQGLGVGIDNDAPAAVSAAERMAEGVAGALDPNALLATGAGFNPINTASSANLVKPLVGDRSGLSIENVNVYNPVPERASDTVAAVVRRKAYAGAGRSQ